MPGPPPATLALETARDDFREAARFLVVAGAGQPAAGGGEFARQLRLVRMGLRVGREPHHVGLGLLGRTGA